MIYTAIFQDVKGKFTSSRYSGSVNRQEAWKNAAKLGESDGNCLVLLLPGHHLVHTYEDIHHTIKDHDVFEMGP